MAPEGRLSLERMASAIGLAARTTYTKQALQERLDEDLEPFLIQVITALFAQLPQGVQAGEALHPFARVLLEDSTVEALPKHLACAFPGAANQYGRHYASLKLQWICDLKSSTALHLSLSGFTRNDQAAAQDVLRVASANDLVLRDLGYFTTAALAQLQDKGVYFLTRYRHGVNVYDPQSGAPLDLAAQLKTHGCLDQEVLLGPERVKVRLVARPVPEEVGNLRRYRAKTEAKRRRRCPRKTESLFLMSWSLFVTNVPVALWPKETLGRVYRLRWRIEIIFKTWKSHLGLRQLNCHSAHLLRLGVLTKLLHCACICQFSDLLESKCPEGQHVSLLRLGRILGLCASFFSALLLEITPHQWLEFTLSRHVFYEHRKDRKNYYQLLMAA